MNQKPDTGISINEEQFKALNEAILKGDYTQYYYLKSEYGSPLSTLYVPGPTGQGFFGTLSHEYSKEFIDPIKFQEAQTRISRTIAETDFAFIQQTHDGTNYQLPSTAKTIELEIQSWQDSGLPSESYAGLVLDKFIGTHASGTNLTTSQIAAIAEAAAESYLEMVLTGDEITYKGKTYLTKDLVTRDGYVFAKDGDREIPIGLTADKMVSSLAEVVQANFMEQNQEIFLGDDKFPLGPDGSPRDAVGLRESAHKILGDEKYESIIDGLKSTREFDAEGRVIGSSTWNDDGSHITSVFDPVLGRRINETLFNPDGSRDENGFDAAGTNPATWWGSHFDAQGRKTTQTIFNDDGTRDENGFDVEGTNPSTWWGSHFDPQGRKTSQTVFNDDGSRDQNIFDATNTNTYDWYGVHWDAQGRKTMQNVFNDDGSRDQNVFDATNANTYDWYGVHWDAQGRKTRQIVFNDDGSRHEFTFDANGNTTLQRNYDKDGKLTYDSVEAKKLAELVEAARKAAAEIVRLKAEQKKAADAAAVDAALAKGRERFNAQMTAFMTEHTVNNLALIKTGNAVLDKITEQVKGSFEVLKNAITQIVSRPDPVFNFNWTGGGGG